MMYATMHEDFESEKDLEGIEVCIKLYKIIIYEHLLLFFNNINVQFDTNFLQVAVLSTIMRITLLLFYFMDFNWLSYNLCLLNVLWNFFG